MSNAEECPNNIILDQNNQLLPVFNDVEIDPRNTFPLISKRNGKEEIKIERHSVNIKLSGNFINIGKFIDEVEKNYSILQMQYCSIGLDSLDPKGVIADLGYLTYGEPES